MLVVVVVLVLLLMLLLQINLIVHLIPTCNCSYKILTNYTMKSNSYEYKYYLLSYF